MKKILLAVSAFALLFTMTTSCATEEAIEASYNIFNVYSNGDWLTICQKVNEGDKKASTANIILKNDITLSGGGEIVPIGTEEHPFKGTFEGMWHKITVYDVPQDNGYAGLFGYTIGVSFKDVTIYYPNTAMNLITEECFGGIVAYAEGSTVFEEVNIEGIEDNIFVLKGSDIRTFYAGGLAGICYGEVKCQECSSNINYSHFTEMRIASGGGLIGAGYCEPGGKFTFIECKCSSDINLDANTLGGMIGSLTDVTEASFKKCDFSGILRDGSGDADEICMGGMVGYISTYNSQGCRSVFNNCLVSNDTPLIIRYSDRPVVAGGIVGKDICEGQSSELELTDCSIAGQILVRQDKVEPVETINYFVGKVSSKCTVKENGCTHEKTPVVIYGQKK